MILILGYDLDDGTVLGQNLKKLSQKTTIFTFFA